MGAIIPIQVAESELTLLLQGEGLQRRGNRGKTSDMFNLPKYPDLMLMWNTSRLSSNDFVLNCLVDKKDELATATTILFYIKVFVGVPNHIVAFGSNIDKYLPKSLRDNPEIQKRGIIVQKLQMLDIEGIGRFHLTGSGLESYTKTGKVCGQILPLKLFDGSPLEPPIFTPSSKNKTGHDEHITCELVYNKYGEWPSRKTLGILTMAYGYCDEHDIIMADGKLEFGRNRVLADKITFDEIRAWDKEEYRVAAAKKKAPQGYDKQPVREWGKTIETPFKNSEGKIIVGIGNLDPENPKHVAFVHSIDVPASVTNSTTNRYSILFQRLNDNKNLENFQREVMGIVA